MKFEILVGGEYGSFVVKSVSLVRDDGAERRKQGALGLKSWDTVGNV